jgi:hypothetical protein
MPRVADIIPIASRRSRAATVVRSTAVRRGPPKGAWILLVILGGLMACGLLFTFAASRAQQSIASLSPLHRSAIFLRAYDELRETCAGPEATNGPVQEHCRSSASFVLLFPECDVACDRAARALLPHARR